MHSAHSKSASPCGYVKYPVKLPLKRDQLTESLFLFLLAAGFLLGIRRRCCLVVRSSCLAVLRSCRGALLRRTGLLYVIHLFRSWFRRGSLRGGGIRGARRFFIGVRRSRSCTHGLHSNVIAGHPAADLLLQVIDDCRRACNGFFL